MNANEMLMAYVTEKLDAAVADFKESNGFKWVELKVAMMRYQQVAQLWAFKAAQAESVLESALLREVDYVTWKQMLASAGEPVNDDESEEK